MVFTHWYYVSGGYGIIIFNFGTMIVMMKIILAACSFSHKFYPKIDFFGFSSHQRFEKFFSHRGDGVSAIVWTIEMGIVKMKPTDAPTKIMG